MGDFDHMPCDSAYALVYELIMATDGRTTDLLETIVNGSLTPKVIRQEVIHPSMAAGEMIYRESVLLDSSENAISHNFVFLKPESMPADLLDELLLDKEPIGKIMKRLNVFSRRTVKAAGWRPSDQITNLEGKPAETIFFSPSAMIPYKNYSVQFSGCEDSGMELLEYFNPSLVERYLRAREVSWTDLERVR